jgi:hypothetical protein
VAVTISKLRLGRLTGRAAGLCTSEVTDQQIEEVVTGTLESTPKNSTHWSTRLMAAETGVSQNVNVRIWRAFGLQPHRVENFKFSKDPQFVAKVRNIVGPEFPGRGHYLVRGEAAKSRRRIATEPILPGAGSSRSSVP